MGPTTMMLAGGHAVFADGVLDVVFLRSNKQVRRIATRPDITSVTNEQASRDGADAKFVGDSVRRSGLAAYPKFSITLMEYSGLPEPAIIRAENVNLCPEPRFVFGSKQRGGTMLNSHDVLHVRTFWSERRAV